MTISTTLARQPGAYEANCGAAGQAIGRHVVSVGFELEGGMGRAELEALELFVKGRRLWERYERDVETGLCIRKYHGDLELKLHSTALADLFGFLEHAYENGGFETNFNCGFHVHIKFDDMPRAASLFSAPSIISEFKQAYEGHFSGVEKYIDRLSSRHIANDSIDGKTRSEGIPYNKNSMINISAYCSKGTIEFRILPHQSTAQEAISSLQWIVDAADEIYEQHQGGAIDSRLTPEMIEMDRLARAKRG